MQKVITITKNVNIPVDQSFTETTYPDLQKLLDDGYVVKDHMLSVISGNSHYGITFILEKSK